MDISKMRLNELVKITGSTMANIKNYFANHEENLVTKLNNRIIGISPEAAEDYIKTVGLDYFYRPAVILSANLCGGVGKTSSIYNLGAALRRITGRDTPIIYVDGDSQGSFTSVVFGKPADDQEPILVDFLEGKASIDDIVTEIKDNVWFIKSNLNQAWIDKVLTKPQDIKKGMLNFYQALFNKFGPQAKIFQDHTPQLSNLFASSICALNQLDNSILKATIVPIRSDKFAIQGADYILKEIQEITDTFSLKNSVDVHCFFSSIDKRISTTAGALQTAAAQDSILKHLSSVVVRYCSEVTKGIMSSSNVYSSGRNNNAASDYQDLLQYIFSFNQTKVGHHG